MTAALRAAFGSLLLWGAGVGGLGVDRRGASAATVGAGRPEVRDGDVDEWLSRVVIDVPPWNFTADSVALQIKAFRCRGIRVGTSRRPGGQCPAGGCGSRRIDGGLTSSVYSEGASRILHVKLEKVEVGCDLDLYYNWHYLGGDVSATISLNDASLVLDADLDSSDTSEPRLPDAVRLGNCTVHLGLNMTISGGSTFTQVMTYIPGVQSSIQSTIESRLIDLICGAGLRRLEVNASDMFAYGARLAREMIGVPRPAPPKEEAAWVNWEHVPLMSWLVRAQREVLDTRRPLDELFGSLFPGSQVCVLGSQTPQVLQPACERRALAEPQCVFGGVNETACAVRYSLRSPGEPSANVRLVLGDARVRPAGIQAGLVVPHGSTWVSDVTVDSFSVVGQLNLTLSGSAGDVFAGNAELAECSVRLRWELQATGLHGSLHTLLGLDSGEFWKVPDFQRVYPGCLAKSFRDGNVSVVDALVNFTVGKVELDLVQNTEANSPLMAEVAKLAADVVQLGRRFDAGMVATLQGLVRRDVRPFLSRALHEWAEGLDPGTCPPPLGEEKGASLLGDRSLIDPGLGAAFGAGAGACLASAALLAAFAALPPGACCCLRRLAAPAAESCPRQFGSWDALCTAPGRSVATAVAVPLAIFFCTLFYVASNVLSFGALTLNLEQGGGSRRDARTTVEMYQVMVFSVLYSIHRLWSEPSLVALGWVLFGASFVLPYLKLLLLLVCWITPTKVLPARWRGIMLVVLDEIGKVSLCDIYVIQFISTVMYASHELQANGERPLTCVLRTNQEPGFTVFVCATVSSLLMGHYVLHCHHAIEPSRSPTAPTPRPRRMGIDTFRREQRDYGTLGIALVLSIALVVLGTVLPAFTVKIRTPFFSLGPYEHSMWSVGLQLPRLSEHPGSFQAVFGQLVYFFFTIVIVYLQLGWLLCVWLYPWLAKSCRWSLDLVGSMMSWAALDVALVSMLLTLVETANSEFLYIEGLAYSRLVSFLGRTVDHDMLLFEVSFCSGFFLLWPAVVLHHCVGRRVLAEFASREASAVDMREEGTELGSSYLRDGKGSIYLRRSCAPGLQAPREELAETSEHG